MSAYKHDFFDAPPAAFVEPSNSANKAAADPEQALLRAIRVGAISIGGLLILAFVMSALINVNGAVIAQGQVITKVQVQHVSHPTGGIIAAMLVEEGDYVRVGQPMIELDSRASGAGAAAAQQSVQQLLASSARLRAERDGSTEINFPAALLNDRSPAAQRAVSDARQMLMLRRSSRNSGSAQIRQQLTQTSREIQALQAQAESAQRQASLIEPELAGLRSLKERGLVTVGRLNQVERSAIELQSAITSSAAQIAQSRAKMAEIRLAGIQAEQAGRAAAAAELNTVLADLGDQSTRALLTQENLDRSIIRAPHNGVVENLRFSTRGSVLPPGQTIVEIVPDSGSLTIELRVAPQDVDAVKRGQIATVRFTGFASNTAPELVGRITRISSQRLIDEKTGESYYKAIIAVSDKEKSRLDKNNVVVGMPVETYLQTGERSLLSYLFSPLMSQFSRAFREG